MDYDIRSEQLDRRGRADPRPREPDRLAAAREGWVAVRAMVPARRRPAADGRALRPRRPRHPAHRHPCLPPLSGGAGRCSRTPGDRWASGSPVIVFGGMLVVVCAFAWFGFDAEIRARVHHLPARHAGLSLGAAGRRRRLRAWSAARVVADARPAGGGQRLPARTATSGPQVLAVHLPPRRAVGHARPRRRHHRSRRWRSRAPTATGRRTAVRELRTLLDRDRLSERHSQHGPDAPGD